MLKHCLNSTCTYHGFVACLVAWFCVPETAGQQMSSSSDCLTSLDAVFFGERDAVDTSVLRTYKLCPDTTFKVANTFGEDGLADDGDNPIIIGRPNVHVLCGDDGKSESNCVLKGGVIQLAVFDQYNSEEAATNAIVQGLTFSGGDSASVNVLANRNGNVTFRDCIFSNNRNSASMFFQAPKSVGQIRRLSRDVLDDVRSIAKGAVHKGNRRRQEDKGDSLTVTIERCSFHNNVVGSLAGETSTGLVTSLGVDLSVKDSTFISNDNDGTEGKIHYMIGNFDGNLALAENCFISNNVSIAPVINQDSEDLSMMSNYGDFTNVKGPPVVCEFIANVVRGDVTISVFDDLAFSCLNFDSDVCTSSKAPIKENDGTMGTPCLTSLTDVYLGEKDVADDSVLRQYFLCPDTVFKVATSFGNDGLGIDGDNPLIIGRPNVYIFCGENGKSENNCTLQGGVIQLAVFDEFDQGLAPAINSLVQGLTFRNATSVNVLANFYADVTFRDCIFAENANAGAMFLQHPSSIGGGRRLQDVISEDKYWFAGRTQLHRKGGEISLGISVANCSFLNNEANAVSSQLRSRGILSNVNSMLTVRETMFVSNGNMAGQGKTDYIIGNFDGATKLFGNCFVHNNVGIAPVVNQYGFLDTISNSGKQDVDSRPNFCEFVADVTEGDILESNMKNAVVDCLNYDTDACALIPTEAPTTSPSLAPVATPMPITLPPVVSPTLSPTESTTTTNTSPEAPTSSPTKSRPQPNSLEAPGNQNADYSKATTLQTADLVLFLLKYAAVLILLA